MKSVPAPANFTFSSAWRPPATSRMIKAKTPPASRSMSCSDSGANRTPHAPDYRRVRPAPARRPLRKSRALRTRPAHRYGARPAACSTSPSKSVRDGLKALDRRRGYRGPLRRLSEAEAQPFLDQQEGRCRRTAPAGARSRRWWSARPPTTCAPDRRARKRRFQPRGMSWARGWTTASFRPGDVFWSRSKRSNSRAVVRGVARPGSRHRGRVPRPRRATPASCAPWSEATTTREASSTAPCRPFVNRARPSSRSFTPPRSITATHRPRSSSIRRSVFDDGSNKIWKPENYEQEFRGPTRLREALVHSINVVTVKVAQHIGLSYLISYLPRFGFDRPFPRNLSIALGSSEVTLLELVRAYDAFATGGQALRADLHHQHHRRRGQRDRGAPALLRRRALARDRLPRHQHPEERDRARHRPPRASARAARGG